MRLNLLMYPRFILCVATKHNQYIISFNDATYRWSMNSYVTCYTYTFDTWGLLWQGKKISIDMLDRQYNNL